jgi:N-acetylmuramoyl-L-alanine amidase
MSVIVIDPGHGGAAKVGNSSANNATGPNGTKEKDLTLVLGLRLYDALQGSGHQVVLTRDTDVNLDLKDRAQVAASRKAAAFVSLHFNGDDDPSTRGTETWVHSAGTADSVLLASSVLQRLVNATGHSNRGVRRKGLGVLSPLVQDLDTAACLAEVSFLTDPDEEARLGDGAYLDSLTAALAQAILDYLNGSSSAVIPIDDGDPNDDGDA